MNIVHFTDTYHPFLNGVTLAVEQFAEKAALKNNVLLVVPAYSLRTSVQKEGSLTIKKVRSIPFPIYPGAHLAIPNIVGLYRLLKEFKPDVIHIHTPFILGILGTIFAQILGVKLVGTFHTLFTQQIMNFGPKRLFLGKQVVADASDHGIIPLVLWKLQIIFFNVCDLVIAPTNIIAETLKKQGIKTQIALLPSGIDIAKFPQKDDYTPTYKIIHLGRLGFEKSTEVIIEAFALVHKKVPTARLVIAGDGPARWGLERLARKMKIRDYVDFLGRIDTGKTSEIYRSCDVFATASTFETQGIVLTEAMLSGLPVVAAAVNAPCDLIKYGKDGYLFSEGNSTQCAEFLIELLLNQKKLERMGKLARKSGEYFDSTALSEKLISTYETLLATQPS